MIIPQDESERYTYIYFISTQYKCFLQILQVTFLKGNITSFTNAYFIGNTKACADIHSTLVWHSTKSKSIYFLAFSGRSWNNVQCKFSYSPSWASKIKLNSFWPGSFTELHLVLFNFWTNVCSFQTEYHWSFNAYRANSIVLALKDLELC